jgi:hypothetical protein
MLEQLKQSAIEKAIKVIAHPKMIQLASDPRLMNALAKGFEIHSKLRTQAETCLRSVANNLNLASKDDLSLLKNKLLRIQDDMGKLK